MYDWSSLCKHVASGLCSRLKWRVANEKTMEEMWSVVLQQEREDPPEPPPGLEAVAAVDEHTWLTQPLREVIVDTANMDALRRACSICGQRLINMQRIKTHWQHTHKDAWECVRAEVLGEMSSLQSILRKARQFCGSWAADLSAHSRQCSVLFQLLATRLLHRRGRLTTARQRAAGAMPRQDKSKPACAGYTVESSPIGKALGLSGSRKAGRADLGGDPMPLSSGPSIAGSGEQRRLWTLNLVLTNPGNHCYANASILALCHACSISRFTPGLRLRSQAQFGLRTTLQDQHAVRAVSGRWVYNLEQQDASEYTGVVLASASVLTRVWCSRFERMV